MLPTSTAVAAGATAAVRPAGPSQCRQRQEDTVTTPPQLSTCRRLSTPLQRLQSREGEVTTFPTAAAASAIAIHCRSLPSLTGSATLFHMCWNNTSLFECVANAAAAGGSDALPRARPRRGAPTQLQLAEAPSLAMWHRRHHQQVCSTAGREAMHQRRSGPQDRRSKGNYTKTGDGRNQTDGRC